jgi:hypothetical protein
MYQFYSSLTYENEFILILLNSINPDGNCTCGSILCNSKGKHPKEKWKNKDFIKDLNISKEGFKYYLNLLNTNQYNIAVQTGFNRTKTKKLLILDFDKPELEKDLISKLKLENTCEVSTGKGIHFYFLVDKSIEIKSKIKPENRGFDILSDGRYAVTVGSVHKTLNKYSWNNKEIKEIPDWLINYLNSFEDKKVFNNKELTKEVTENLIFSNKKLKQIPVGKRNNTLFKELLRFVKFNPTVNYNIIKKQALKIKDQMEDKDSFPDAELEKVISSVLSYKENNKIKVNHTFSLEKASEIWTKKLTNLGLIETDSESFLKFKKFYEELENFILKHGIIKRELTENYLGKTITEFISYRNELMDKLFFGVPLWNYLNIKHQNWAFLFNQEKIEKRKYRGVKYFGKGNSTQERIGFAIDFVDMNIILNQLKIKFGRFVFKFLNKVLHRKNYIKKTHEETDYKILSFFNFASSENFLQLNNAREFGITSGLTAENSVPKFRDDDMRTENNQKNSSKSTKLVKEIKVKNKINKNHTTKYNSIGNIFFEEKNLMYSFDVTSDPEGLLQDRDKVLEVLSNWKKNDVVGIGLHIYVFDSVDMDNDVINVFESFELKDCVPLDIKSKKKIPFSLLNKYMVLEHLEVLYRDGEIFSDNENDKYVTYELYDNNDNAEEIKEENNK